MNCDQVRELLPELASGMEAGTPEPELNPEIESHIASCPECAKRLGEMRKTMALLDEWRAPEPSPYFDTKLTARFREEVARSRDSVSVNWLSWIHRPAWAMSVAALLLAVGLGVGFGVNGTSLFAPTETIATKPPTPGLPVEPGTAVGDLQALDRNDDLYADFDVLDQLQVQDDVTATQ